MLIAYCYARLLTLIRRTIAVRYFAIAFMIFAALQAHLPAAAEQRVTFRLFLSDLMRIYAQGAPEDREPMFSLCEVAEDQAARKHPGNEAWKGMVSQCFGAAALLEDLAGSDVACAYFIEAAAHYEKARPAPDEIEALRLSIGEVKAEIAKLGC